MAGQLLKTYRFLGCRIFTNNGNGFNNMQPSVRTIKSETKNLLKELKVPEKPKRPLTPYIQYLKEKQANVAKENPNMKQADILRIIAQNWKEVSQDQREKYVQKFQSESKSYNVAILNYNACLTDEQQDILKTAASEKKNERKKRMIRKLCKENNKPKRPVGPYILFLQEESKARNIPIRDIMSTIKGEWETLPEAEKMRYTQQYMAQKKNYEKALVEWEQEMVAKGLSELVRVKSIVADKNHSRIISLKTPEGPHQ